MTTFSDEIATKLRDYVVDGDPLSGNYSPDIADIRSILTTLALATYTVAEVEDFILAASVADARTAIGLGSASSPTFAALTVTGNITFDTSTLTLIASTNRVGIGTAAPTTGLDVDLAADFSSTVAFGGATTFTALAAMTGATGKLSIGNASIPTVGTLSGVESLSVTGTGNPASMSVSRFSADAVGPYLTLYKSRSGSIGSHTALQANDVLGEIVFGGSTGAAAGAGARIAALAGSGVTTGSLPTDLVFSTTASGSVVPSIRLRLDTGGRILLAGQTASVDVGGFTGTLQHHATTGTTWTRARYDASTTGVIDIIAKSRSGVAGSTGTVLQDGDDVFLQRAYGDSGSGWVLGAGYLVEVDGAPSGGNVMMRHVWQTLNASGAFAERMRIASDGFVSFGDSNTGIQGGLTDILPFYTAGAERLRIDSSGRVLIGHTAGLALLDTIRIAQVQISSNAATNNTGLSIANWSNGTTAVASLTFAKSLSGTIGTPGAVDSATRIGQIDFTADDGTALRQAAFIRAEVDGTPGSGDMPGRIVFGTTADGTASSVEVMRIDSAGLLSLSGATTTGIRRPSAGLFAIRVTGADVLTATTGGAVWLAGQTAHAAVNGYNSMLQLHHASNASFSRGQWANNAFGVPDEIVKSRSGVVGTNTVVQVGDGIRQYNFWADHGSGFAIAAQHLVEVASISSTVIRGRFRWLVSDATGLPLEALRISETRFISFGDTNTGIQGGVADEIPIHTGGVERMRLDASGRLIIGHTAAINIGASSSYLHVYGTATGANVNLGRYSADSAGFLVNLGKSRGATIGTSGAVQNSDTLGTLSFLGDDGTSFIQGAWIATVVDGTPATGDVPTRMSFGTRPSGGGGAAESLRISPAGAIHFPRISTTASAANAFLDSGASPANQLLRSTSSLRYKRVVQDLTEVERDYIDLLRPVTYQSKAAADDPNRRWYGFIAEEVAEVDPRLVTYTVDEYGESMPDGVQYDRLVVLLTAKVKRLQERIAVLEAA